MMLSSEQTNEVAAAMVKAQSEMDNAVLNKVNPRFKSKYADLTAIREATLPHLNNNGLAIVHAPRVGNDGLFVMAGFLVHTSGQWIGCEWPLPINGSPQEMGSATTYAKRYTWAALCGISADEDDDANAAEDQAKPASPAKPLPPKPEPLTVQPPVNPQTGKVEPHYIPFEHTERGEASDMITWAQNFIAGIGSGKTDEEISFWERKNIETLQKLQKQAPGIYKRLSERVAETYEKVRLKLHKEAQQASSGGQPGEGADNDNKTGAATGSIPNPSKPASATKKKAS